MQHRLSSEPAVSSASQEYLGTSLDQKIHHRVENSQPLGLSGATLITVKPSDNISGRSIFIWFCHLRLGLPSGLLLSGFPTKTLYGYVFSSYLPHPFPSLIFFHLINTINIWPQQGPWRSPLSIFFHPPVTSSVLDQNTLLITPFYNTFNLCSSVDLEGQVSHPYATSGIIIVLSSKGQQTICRICIFGDSKKY